MSKETLKNGLFTKGWVGLRGQEEMAKHPGIISRRRKLLSVLGLKGKREGAAIGILHVL